LNQFMTVKNADFYKSYDILAANLERVLGAKMEQLLDPTFKLKNKTDAMEDLEKQEGTLNNFLGDDDEEDDIPSFATDTSNTVTEEKVEDVTEVDPPTPDVTANDADLQGLADLEGLQGI